MQQRYLGTGADNEREWAHYGTILLGRAAIVPFARIVSLRVTSLYACTKYPPLLLAQITINAHTAYRGAKGERRAISTADLTELIIFLREALIRVSFFNSRYRCPDNVRDTYLTVTSDYGRGQYFTRPPGCTGYSKIKYVQGN